MHPYLGDFAAGQTVHLAFNTSDLGAAPITLGGLGSPITLCQVYRDDGDTQDTSGITPDVDSDSVTGFHRVAIDLSSDATFYAVGHDFFVVVSEGTVDSVSVVGKVVAHFSVRNRSAHAVIADSTPSVGSRPTPDQALLMITRFLMAARDVAGSTMTLRKEDNSTAAMTFTLTLITPTEASGFVRAT